MASVLFPLGTLLSTYGTQIEALGAVALVVNIALLARKLASTAEVRA